MYVNDTVQTLIRVQVAVVISFTCLQVLRAAWSPACFFGFRVEAGTMRGVRVNRSDGSEHRSLSRRGFWQP